MNSKLKVEFYLPKKNIKRLKENLKIQNRMFKKILKNKLKMKVKNNNNLKKKLYKLILLNYIKMLQLLKIVQMQHYQFHKNGNCLEQIFMIQVYQQIS